jgi:hypothetical protein
MNVKCTRGDVNNSSAEYIRNETYFNSYDNNHIEDLELYNIHYNS